MIKMKIVMVSSALNIHQVSVANELYKLTNGNYWFIQTETSNEENRKGGNIDSKSYSYCVCSASSQSSYDLAVQLIKDADVMLFDDTHLDFLKVRISTGKLTFNVGERWFKRGILNILSPRLLKQQWFYHTYCHGKPFYNLCASAYASGDFAKMFAFRGKCFKWGYFTEVPALDIESIQKLKSNSPKVKILWVGRFLKLKHPEQMVKLALFLYSRNVDFLIEMIGMGPEFARVSSLIKIYQLEKYIKLLGALPNKEVVEKMRSHDIFCFTSDRREGWGAVLNEAMSAGCCPVSSIAAGSTLYLIKNGQNGLIFDLKIKNDLCEQVFYLIEHPETRKKMGVEAYKTMRNFWNPKNAALKLYQLCDALLKRNVISINEGPCSKA